MVEGTPFVCSRSSTISETVNATTRANIQEMEAVVKQVFRECSQCYQHDYKKNWMLLDIDLTGLLAGKKA